MRLLSNHGAPSSSEHNHHIDVLRGIAALTVLFAHGDHSNLLLIPFVSANKEFFGSFGVKLFFMLSGYLIWASAQRTILESGSRVRGLIIYLIHRITRIAPLYYVNILFCAFLLGRIGSTFSPEVTSDVLFRHFTFTQDLAPSVSRALNPVLWTITHEAMYYLLVPMLLLSTKRHAVLLLGSLAAGALAGILAWPSTMVPFLNVLWLFSIGAALSYFHKREWLTRSAWCAFGFCVLYAAARKIDPQTLAAIASVLVFLTLGVGRCSYFISRASLVTKPLALAGVISYSIYIWHYLILNILAWHSDSIGAELGSVWQGNLFRGFFTLVCVLIVSTVSYFVFERPGMGILRNLLVGVVNKFVKPGTRPVNPLSDAI